MPSRSLALGFEKMKVREHRYLDICMYVCVVEYVVFRPFLFYIVRCNPVVFPGLRISQPVKQSRNEPVF